MRTRLILSFAVLAAAVLPAAAHAAGSTFTGVVVAKEAKRGTLVVATQSGAARTVHARLAAARLGDRIRVGGAKLSDGTVRASSLRVLGHVRSATVQGVVVRRLASRTLVSTGGSVIAIGRRSATRSLASRGLAPGSIARFGVAIGKGGVRETSAKALGTTTTVEVEGQVVTVSPLVVNVEGLPISVTVPDQTLLPATLAVGDEVELSVSVDANNVFTLVSVDSVQAGVDQGGDQGGDQGSGDDGQPGADDGGSGDQAGPGPGDDSSGDSSGDQGSGDQGSVDQGSGDQGGSGSGDGGGSGSGDGGGGGGDR
jgi:hypothetical protein